MHEGPDWALATVVASILLAFVLGGVARLLRLPMIVGYLAAGVLIGPYTPGFVAERGVVGAMAEVGVALLLFGVGLHFRPADLLAVWRVAVPGALLQITLAMAAGTLVGAWLLGLPFAVAPAFGLALAISSTAVATRVLTERGLLGSESGRIALGWLVMQDLVVVFALVMLPAIAAGKQEDGAMLRQLGMAALSLAGFAALMWVFGRRALPWMLARVARGGSHELFTLAVVAMALGVAFLASALFGVSFALGAFFAGVVLGESDVGHQAAAEATPLQRIFAAIFFVSIGMLLDPGAVAAQPFASAGALLSVLLAIGGGTLVILLALRVHPRTAVIVAGAIAQIGEFSFLLVELAIRREILPVEVRGPVLVAAVASIVATPLALKGLERLAPRLERSARLAWWRGVRRPRLGPPPPEAMQEGHAVVVGSGRVGALVTRALRRHGVPVVVVEADRMAAERLKADGVAVIWGDATRPQVLHAAGLDRAGLLVLALPGAVEARAVLDLARAENAALHAIVRTHSDAEAAVLEALDQVGLVMMGEREVALGMAEYALERLGVPPAEALATVGELRVLR
jgi:CPA2 family monovalent cation:H+ antiporter-2